MNGTDEEIVRPDDAGYRLPPVRAIAIGGAAVLGVAAAVVIGLFVLWYAREVLLVAFAGLLLALFLETLSRWLSRWTRLPYGVSLFLVVVVLIALTTGCFWMVGSRLSQQLAQLAQAVPKSFNQLRGQVGETPWGKWLQGYAAEPGKVISDTGVVSGVTGIASGLFRFMVDTAVILFVGLYGAAQPQLYVDGMVRLFPLTRRDRIRKVLDEVGDTLRWWLFGQLFAMFIIGLLTGIGLWLLGSPLPLGLGVLAFALEIVPDVGAIVAAVPAILLAWAESPVHAGYVLLLYVGIHAVEAYLLMPLVQLKTVHLPPALQILAVILSGLLAGLAGILVAAPLLIAGMVLIRTLYVEDILGDRTEKDGS